MLNIANEYGFIERLRLDRLTKICAVPFFLLCSLVAEMEVGVIIMNN